MTEFNPKDKCPYCGDIMVKHIIKEGARYHVTSWYKGKNGATSHCSEPTCENNHGPGHCIPLEDNDLAQIQLPDKLKKRLRNIFNKHKVR